MTLQEVMKQLEACGTAQNRKVYARHGASPNMFGVSYANLYKFQKQIKVDHELAQQLWATGVHDAQILATLVADPNAMTDKQAEEWVKNTGSYPIGEMLARFMAKTPLWLKKAEKWSRSKDEFIGMIGWTLLALLAMDDKSAGQSLGDEYFENCLEIIENDIHKRKNRVRHEMNGALIAIGLRNDRLEKKALAVAAKIGKVEVDHGETSCKTPDAAEYIQKTRLYKHKKKAKAAAK